MEWWDLPRNRSRLITFSIGLFVLVGAVFFSTQISNLFNLFGSRAGILPANLEETWEMVEATGGENRMHGNALEIDGWLYVVGGMDVKTNVTTGEDDVVMLSSVQRISIDQQTGLVEEGAIWQSLPSMNFGHAEFGLVAHDGYLYVVGGDIHVPPEVEGKVPLLYSTVERLELGNPDATWEVYALLSGVNFYPEVSVNTEGIHVVGGIYGNPFPPLPGMDADKQHDDILNNGGAAWNDLNLGNKPVLGSVGLYLPVGHANTPIATGTGAHPQQPGLNTGEVSIIDTGGVIVVPPPLVVSMSATSPSPPSPSSLIPPAFAAGGLEFTRPADGSNDIVYQHDIYQIKWDRSLLHNIPGYPGGPRTVGVWYQKEGMGDEWMKIGDTYTRYYRFGAYEGWYTKQARSDLPWVAPEAPGRYRFRTCAMYVSFGDPHGGYWKTNYKWDPDFGGIGAWLPSGRTWVTTNNDNVSARYSPSCSIASDISDYVTVVGTSRPLTMRVTAPTSATVLQTGDNININWEVTRDDGAPVSPLNPAPPVASIWFRQNTGFAWELVSSNTPNDGSFGWQVGQLNDGSYEDPGGTLPNAQIKVCLSSTTNSNPNCSGLLSALSQELTVREEFWIDNLTTGKTAYYDNNDQVNIKWDYHGPNATVTLEMSRNNGPWEKIQSGIPATNGGFVWRTYDVPDGTTDSVRFRASLHSPTYRDIWYLPVSTDSAPITIQDRGGATIRFLQPAAGVNWEPDTDQRISWYIVGGAPEPEDDKNVMLSYSVNGETNWQNIGFAKMLDSGYSWRVPNVYADTARIKAVVLDGDPAKVNTVYSDYFSIHGPDLSDVLSKALIAGDFVTTVGEHIIINTTNAASSQTGEIGGKNIDYAGNLSENWTVGEVAHIGHLRFLITKVIQEFKDDGSILAHRWAPVYDYRAIAVPQGRYGHEIAWVNNQLTVFGGASWAKEVRIEIPYITNSQASVQDVYSLNFKNFWVIDDKIHPFHEADFDYTAYGPTDPNFTYPAFDYGRASYKFLGNIAMKRNSGTSWSGSQYPGGFDGLAFKNLDGTKQGRAFFGFNTFIPNATDYIAVGGLQNISNSIDTFTGIGFANRLNTYFRVPVGPTATTEFFPGSWVTDENYGGSSTPLPLYNISTAGLDGGVVAYSGQADFQYEIAPTGFGSDNSLTIAHDPHVPNYPVVRTPDGSGGDGNIGSSGPPAGDYEFVRFEFRPETAMYIPALNNSPYQTRWNQMAVMPNLPVPSFFASTLVATNLADNPSRVVYKYGGMLANDLEFLGAFAAGVPDPASITIDPNVGKQSQRLSGVEITGTAGETHLQSGKTEIIFAKPSNLTLSHGGNDTIPADEWSQKTITASFVNAQGKSVAGQPITFSITGGGQFWPPSSNQVETNELGVASIQYRVGATTGIVQITATTTSAGANYTSNLWLRATQPNSTAYELDIFEVAPKTVTDEGEQVAVKVKIYETINGTKTNITGDFTHSDVLLTVLGENQTFTPSTPCFPTDTPCLAYLYTPSVNADPDSIVAAMLITDNNLFISDRVEVQKKFPTNGTEEITLTDLTINDINQIATFNLAIGAQAPVGVWQVIVLSPAVTESGFAYTERLVTTFTVEPADFNTGPRLIDISPNVSDRGQTLTVAIQGAETNFDHVGSANQRSSVILESAPNNDNPGDNRIVVPVADVKVYSSTYLEATITIPATARLGYWDVYVQTAFDDGPDEIAEYFGTRDFTIISANGYVMDLAAEYDSLPRDGASESNVVGALMRFNPQDGGLEPVANAEIALGFKDIREQGKLDRDSVVTDTNGSFSFTYTIDGELPDTEPIIAVIQADTQPADDTWVHAETSIIKQKSDYEFALVSDATLIQILPNQTPPRALLTATLTHPTDPHPLLTEHMVHFSIMDGSGALQPSLDQTDFSGKAVVWYLPDQAIGPVTVRARAFIEGVGWIFSNPVTMTKINGDTDRYRLDWTTDKTVLEAGSNDIAHLTATITDSESNNAPVGGWPVAFRLIGNHSDDFLTIRSGNTNIADGTLKTNFVVGNQVGNLLAVAEPLFLAPASLPLQKTVSQEIGYTHISAVPYRVPADGVARSYVTVTIKNIYGGPISGLPVAVSSSNPPLEDIYNSAGNSIPQGTTLITDASGRVFFSLTSGMVHVTNAIATVSGQTLQAPISFQNNLLRIDSLGITVPTQARDYDYDDVANPGIWLTIRKANSAEPYEVNEAYYRDSQKMLQGIPSPFYLEANTTYDIWVKGRNHLASVKQFTTTTSPTVSVVFDPLKAADLAPDRDATTGNLTPWRDNKVNTIDAQVFFEAWGVDSYLADLVRDFKVNTQDFSTYWITNFGVGAPKP